MPRAAVIVPFPFDEEGLDYRRAEMEQVVRSIRKIETATEPRFQELFVAAMALPHATARNPLLAAVVDLPERDDIVPTGADSAEKQPPTRRRRAGRRR